MRKFNEPTAIHSTKITSENLKNFSQIQTSGEYGSLKKKKQSWYLILTFCFSFEYKGTYAYIDEIYLEKEFQNQELALRAMKFAMREAKNSTSKCSISK